VGSKALAADADIGCGPSTIRNELAVLEEQGLLAHPHTSAGRVPTDLAYRFFVDRLMEPHALSPTERESLEREVGLAGSSAIERLVMHATRALSLISNELGVAMAPRLEDAVLEKLELIQVSSNKVLLVATIRGGVVRTVYVDLPIEVPQEMLVKITVALNERLAGSTFQDIRLTLHDRLKDVARGEPGEELMNIFVQSGAELFDLRSLDSTQLHLGHTSVLASQPEFETSERMKGLIELTEQRDLLAEAVGLREHGGRLRITIGGENDSSILNDFTLVTAEYRVGDLKGVIGVIGPTRMPYEKVVTIVDYTSTLVSRVLGT